MWANCSQSKINSIGINAIIAGMVGGMIEIIWVSLYSSLSSVSATSIAKEISITLLPFTENAPYAAMLGILIHLILSLILAISFSALILKPTVRQFENSTIILCSGITLAIIWAVNFFIVLPIVNPSFISLMPYIVTLISKLLFGFAMAWVFIKQASYSQVEMSH